MYIKKQMQRDYEKDLDNLFVEDFMHLLRVHYKKQISERIKQGLVKKKEKNKYGKNY